jgi:hypothetical protein
MSSPVPRKNVLPVSLQFHEVFREVILEAGIRDVPQLDGAVLGGGGDDVVVERVPFYVVHLAAVAGDLEDDRKVGCDFRAVLSNILSLSPRQLRSRLWADSRQCSHCMPNQSGRNSQKTTFTAGSHYKSSTIGRFYR